jgi:hypothetical protein
VPQVAPGRSTLSPARGHTRPREERIMRVPRHRFLLICCALCLPVPALALAHPHAPAAAAPDVRLSEILAAPARDWDGNGVFSSRDDEWIEIFNGGAATADLSSLFVTDGDSIPRFGFTGTLAPGAALLVTGAMSVNWERATAHPVFGLSLGNTGDQVLLWRVTGPDTTLVDGYTYKTHESAADRAVGRTPDGSEWKLEDQLDPYAGTTQPVGTGCPPTPGVPNSCGVVPTRQTSWGHVKAMYR